jgi:hypothetical protein
MASIKKEFGILKSVDSVSGIIYLNFMDGSRWRVDKEELVKNLQFIKWFEHSRTNGDKLTFYRQYRMDGDKVAEGIEIVTEEDQAKSDVGLRYDAGKLRVDLIHPAFIKMLGELMTEDPTLRLDLIPKSLIRELAIVFTTGTDKYPARNWEKGMPWSKVIGPADRHWLKFKFGGKRDKELTKCHHLAQAIWNMAVLLEYETTHPELDDRKDMWPDWSGECEW